MRTFKLTLEYDGSRYSGWQAQINAPRTVQGELQQVADEIFGVAVDVQGAGRTDAGVHALGQVAHLKARTVRGELAPARILRELNDRLPSSIAVLECVEAPAKFHARHDAVSRAYFYQISTRKAALSKRFVWWIKEPLDVESMQKAAALIGGAITSCASAPRTLRVPVNPPRSKWHPPKSGATRTWLCSASRRPILCGRWSAG